MIRLSVAVQTHPLRAGLARELAMMVGAPCELVLDPEPEGRPSPWRTYRHALELTPADATHRLVIQDDAVPCRSFMPALERAIAVRPDRLIALFVGGLPHEHARALFRACAAGSHWAELDNLRWCPAVAVVWPVDQIPRILEYVDRQKTMRLNADDQIIGRFLQASRQRALATVPSLVEHPDDIPSLNGRRQANGRDRTRVAACFIADDIDPRTIDW